MFKRSRETPLLCLKVGSMSKGGLERIEASVDIEFIDKYP